MASVIAEEQSMKRIEDAGDGRPPVLLLPGLNGDSPSLASFRADLGRHFRFVVVEYPPWRTMVTGGCSLQMISDAAMTTVLAAMPEGVVRIAGYSLGSAVAYDVARRLSEAGRTIEWFVVLDTDVETGYAGRGLRSSLRTLWNVFASLRRRDSALDRCACGLATWLTRPASRPWLLRLVEGRFIERLPAALRFALEMQLCELLQQRAFRHWLIEAGSFRLPGHAYVIRSQERRRTLDPQLGWNRLFEEVTVREVSGDHRDMLRLPYRTGLVEVFLSLVGSRSAVPSTGALPTGVLD
jgi:thioesterase domain-containing protein